MGKRRNSFVASDGEDPGDERPAKVSKKATKATNASKPSGGAQVDSDGNTFWEISSKRRVVVAKFKGNIFVNLREYYEDNSGAMKPGKKGISLSVEQYQALAGLVPSISAELRNMGVSLEGDTVDDDDDDGDDAGEQPAKVAKKPNKAKKKSGSNKANIEATSDEDDE